jgi:hypothetical protein
MMPDGGISSVASLGSDLLAYSKVVVFLLCPLLILLGAALPPRRGRPYRLAALVVLGLGTASLFFAMPDGGTVDSSSANSDSSQWLCHSLATEARIIFIGLTAIYIGMILLPEILRRRNNRLFSTVLPLSFLLLYSAGAIFLVQTADSSAAATWKIGVHASDPPRPPSSGRMTENRGN